MEIRLRASRPRSPGPMRIHNADGLCDAGLACITLPALTPRVRSMWWKILLVLEELVAIAVQSQEVVSGRWDHEPNGLPRLQGVCSSVAACAP
jgi:hypothetical protein